MDNKWTRKRVILAIAIAVVADLIQFPLTAAEATVVLAAPGEVADVMMDIFVMVTLVCLIGFHWLLLPTIFAEFIPGLDLFPTWTGCVLVVIGRKDFGKNQKTATAEIEPLKTARSYSTVAPVIDVSAVTTVTPPRLPASAPPTPAHDRLDKLNTLLENKLISQVEYDAKRQQILSEL